MRRAAKVDISQQSIVDTLRKLGDYVAIIRQPVDLLVCSVGIWWTIEAKGTKPKRIEKAQRVHALEAMARGAPHYVVKNAEEAIAFRQSMLQRGRAIA